jgi:hypothetical protein
MFRSELPVKHGSAAHLVIGFTFLPGSLLGYRIDWYKFPKDVRAPRSLVLSPCLESEPIL